MKLSAAICCLLLPLLAAQSSYAQSAPAANDGTTIADNPKPTATLPAPIIKKEPFQPNPKRAGLYSAILPGLGQFYNRQYWKIPVIYGGLAVAGYYYIDNLTLYRSYREAYVSSIGNNHRTDKYATLYTPVQLQQLQNDYNKFLNLTVLFTTLGYTLQVMEAITGAHLKNFDVSRDISLHMQPVVYPKAVGMGLVVNFK